jgi:hypothetical protein
MLIKLLFPTLLLAGGCFSYAPVQSSVAPTGAQVRVHLTDAAYSRIERSMDWLFEPYLVGHLVARDTTGSILLEITSETLPNRRSVDTPLHERITLPRGDILGLEYGKVNAARTASVVAVLAAAAYVVFTGARRTLGPPADRQ